MHGNVWLCGSYPKASSGRGFLLALRYISEHWQYVRRVPLRLPQRADVTLWNIQEQLRLGNVSEELWTQLWDHRSLESVDAQSIKDLFWMHPDTTLVCISRFWASNLNALSQEALFGGDVGLGSVNVDEGVGLTRISLNQGLRCVITFNIRKDAGLVNGSRCTVHALHRAGVVVDLRSGRKILRPYREGKTKYFTLSRAYASTLMRIQGSTLEHITIVPDVLGVPGAAYVCASRVRSLLKIVFLVKPDQRFFRASVGV